MAYNHAREKYKWDRLKNKEEKILREFGMPEEMIQELRDYDWKMFKKERVYYHWNVNEEEFWEKAIDSHEASPENMHSLLDRLDNQELYYALSALDEVTLKIIFYRVQKYSYREIEMLTGVHKHTVSTKLSRLRKKLKKFLK